MTNSKAENTGYKDSPLGKIPSDWEVRHFEDIAVIDKDSLKVNTPKDYQFEYVSLSDVDSEIIEIETSTQIFGTAPSRARRIVKKGDILMSTVRPNLQGFSLIRNEVKDLIASTGFAVISTTKCNNEFLYHYLFSSGISKQFYQLLVGSNYPAINSSDVKRLKLPLPPLPEQTRIAEVLSAWDKAISNVQATIEQVELRNKWLMQELLTGKRRLKGFSGECQNQNFQNDRISRIEKKGKTTDSDDWKKVQIKDVAKEVSIRNKDNKQLTVLSCTKYDGLVDSLEYWGRQIFSEDISTYKIVPKNHFAYATNHIEEGSIGYQNICDEALISPMYTVFKTDKSVNDEYFFKLLKSHRLIYEYNARMEGSIDRRGGLRWDAFSILKINLPSLEEQIAITQVLQAADKEVQVLRSKLDRLKEQKKGLMQVLLTGKKRLIV